MSRAAPQDVPQTGAFFPLGFVLPLTFGSFAPPSSYYDRRRHGSGRCRSPPSYHRHQPLPAVNKNLIVLTNKPPPPPAPKDESADTPSRRSSERSGTALTLEKEAPSFEQSVERIELDENGEGIDTVCEESEGRRLG